MGRCTVVICEAGTELLAEGDELSRLVIVTSGRFELRRGGEVVGAVKAGDHTAVTTLLHPRPSRATMVADEDSTVLELSRQSFWDLVRERPWLGLNLLERLCSTLSRELDASAANRDDGDDTTTPLADRQMV